METITEISTAPTMEVKRNPKDSMKSTWRKDRSQWTYEHWLYEILGLHPNYLDRDTPVHSKTDKLPLLPDWQMQRWVLFHALLPLGLHQAYVWLTGHNVGAVVATIFYSLAFKAIAIHEIHVIRHLGHIYGFLDGDKHVRDEVPGKT